MQRKLIHLFFPKTRIDGSGLCSVFAGHGRPACMLELDSAAVQKIMDATLDKVDRHCSGSANAKIPRTY
jgi:hypothetical protein